MNLRLLTPPLLATGLLLSTLGCSKKDDPEPALEGDWDVLSGTTILYHANGTQYGQNTATYPVGNVGNARYARFTSTTWQVIHASPSATEPVIAYTRSGTILTTIANTFTITQLTATDLTITSATATPIGNPPPTDYSTLEMHYKRR